MTTEQMPMAELDTDEAALLGDLSLIVLDLRSVIDICRKLQTELVGEQQDASLIEALWTTALIKYIRCFTSGKRFGLQSDVFNGLEGDSVGAHQYFKDMRDKHVAHSVNPFEEVRVGVVLSTASAEIQAVEGVSILSRKLICIGAEGVETLMQLASIVHKVVASRAQDLQDALLKWAQAQPVTVFRAGPLGLVTPGSGMVGKPRRRA